MTNQHLKTTIIILTICIVSSSIAFVGYIVYAQSNQVTDVAPATNVVEESENIKIETIFKSSPLPKQIKEMIIGVSFKSNTPVDIEDLRYIQVTYVDMEGTDQLGELIAHKSVAQDLVDIFKELYIASFPIAQMQLIDYYDASDERSMNANNTTCFNTRTVTLDHKEMSLHAYGVAIDINPVQNPYINEELILPIKGKSHVDRELYSKGMVLEDGPVYKAFTKRGWRWGGQWETLKDYQHFEKEIIINGSE